jgi:RsiW-degrading membrane proteinase PrsW (M82 family)
MTVTLVLSAIVAPALFWTGYFYYKDRFQPEPLLKFGASYILGFVSAIGCLKLYELLALAGVPNVLSARLPAAGRTGVLAGLFLAGPVEEFCKFLPFRLVTLRYREFDEKTDGIVYASAVALGFASFENLGYLGYLGGFALFGRALASPLTHAVFASVWGYAVGSAKIGGKRLLPAALGGLSLSALIHGLFNVLTISSAWRLVGALLILGVWLWIIFRFENQAKNRGRS